MNRKYQLFITHVEEFRVLCIKELAERKAGIPGESTIEQLEEIVIPEMDKLLSALTPDTIPPREKRFLISFAYAFRVWGWDMRKGHTTELYRQLAALHLEYEDIAGF